MIAIPRKTTRPAARRAPARALTILTIALLTPAAAHGAAGGAAISAASAAPSKASKSSAASQARSVSRPHVRRAQTLLRTTVTGSNDPATRVIVKRFQQLRGLTTTGIIDRATYREIRSAFALLEVKRSAATASNAGAAGGVAPTVGASRSGVVFVLPANLAPFTTLEASILAKIGECESHGNPLAVSPNRKYRGKYQFDRSTWKTVGGTGDPAAASELEQDQRAAILLRQRGTGPWPVCGVTL